MVNNYARHFVLRVHRVFLYQSLASSAPVRKQHPSSATAAIPHRDCPIKNDLRSPTRAECGYVRYHRSSSPPPLYRLVPDEGVLAAALFGDAWQGADNDATTERRVERSGSPPSKTAAASRAAGSSPKRLKALREAPVYTSQRSSQRRSKTATTQRHGEDNGWNFTSFHPKGSFTH